jgi:Bax protein
MKTSYNPSIHRSSALIVALLVFAFSTGSSAQPINFSEYPAGKPRKDAFFNHFLPLALEENKRILGVREKLETYKNSEALSSEQKQWLDKTAATYRMPEFDAGSSEEWQELLTKVDVIPPSLVMAQSANESAWGTSRFAREVNNYFGQWCFEPGCGIVPKRRSKNATHEVLAFDTAKQSVRSYMHYLNTSRVYKKLRAIRLSLRNKDKPVTGSPLATGLEKYSARGLAYVSEIKAMIRQNKLEKHDHSF